MHRIVIPVEPKPFQRHRFAGRHVYSPKAYEDYKAVLQAYMRVFYKELPMSGPFSVSFEFNFQKPKKPKYAYPCNCDIDNCVKSQLDAGNGILWLDDRYAVNVHAVKRYANSPSVVIIISLAVL